MISPRTIKMLVAAGFALAACGGSDSDQPFRLGEDAGPDAADKKRRRDAGLPDQFVPDAARRTEFVAGVAATDYVNPGLFNLFSLDTLEYDPTFSVTTGSCPVVRSFQDPDPIFGLVNRFAGNSFLTVDPVARTASEPVPTGDGSNPWDLVLVGAYAYVARYDLGDVAKINRETGEIEAVIGLTDFVNNDPRPGAMALYNGEVGVLLQNLLPDFSVDSRGIMVFIDTASDRVVRDFEIGFNPGAVAVSEERDRFYVVHTGSYNDPVSYPASVAEMDPATGDLVDIDLNGVALGNPTDIALSETTGYVLGGFPTAAFAFSLSERRFTRENEFESTGFASENAIAGGGMLVTGDRLLVVDGEGLWVRNLPKGKRSGPFAMTFPTVSVAVAEVPRQQ